MSGGTMSRKAILATTVFRARSRHTRLTSTMRSRGPDADTRDAALARSAVRLNQAV
jgi:hypothetical protein